VVLESPCSMPGEVLADAKVPLATVGLHPTTKQGGSDFYISPSLVTPKSEGGFTPNPKIKAGWPNKVGE